MQQLAVRVLGSFAASADGQPITEFAYTKVRALLAYLALEGAQPLPRGALAGLLWPEQPERNARSSLSQALTTLRTVMGDREREEPLLIADAQHVWLNPNVAVALDVRQLLMVLDEAERHQHRSWRTCALCEERLRVALAHYRGDFLADLTVADSALFEEWANQRREYVRQRVLSALERLVARAEWRGDYGTAVNDARRLVALDLFVEQSWRAAMRLLALNGEAAAALAMYRQLQTLLAEELGAEPDQLTTALYAQIRAGDTASLRVLPPPFIAPTPTTTLVGRDEALQALRAELRDGARALTLTGVGGIGKTRLALAAAHALRFDFEDGVFWVELAALSDSALVASAIARAVGVKERARQPLDETLREHLGSRHTLLILDNFEHLIASTPLVADLLAGCPGLSVLVTSRAPLQLRAERQLILEPLAETAAVQLFRERAHAVGAALNNDEASTALHAAICRRIDRLPLAIELIAVRAHSLTADELLRQLEQPLEALSHGPRDLSARHQSLRHAIQWSYDLLESEAQRAFRSLGAFAGGCTAEAAQAVLGPTLVALPLLEILHQASLVQSQVVAEQTRYVLLETIREFALEQLVRHDEATAVYVRHAAWFATFATEAYDELLRPAATRWAAWIAAELPNLRAALAWAQAEQRHELTLQLATGVWRFHYSYQGCPREGLEQLEASLTAREHAPLELQVKALRAAGVLAGGLNDYQRARHWFEAAIDACWRLGDPALLQATLTNFGFMLVEQGELEEARTHLEVSLALAERSAERWVAKYPLGILAGLYLRLGEHERAQALSEEGLRLNRQRQDPEGTADALRTLGQIALARGQVERARQLGEEALAAHLALNHPHGVGFDLRLLGDVARAAGDLPAALEHYRHCLERWRDREHLVAISTVLDRIAQVLRRLDASERAAALLSAAAAIRGHVGARLTADDQAACDGAMQACEAALGPATFADAWAAGRTWSVEHAIECALQPL